MKENDNNNNNLIALVKISNYRDRLIPLGLACLQAYLKAHDIPVKLFNFRYDTHELPEVLLNPLSCARPTNMIMNHDDLPILLTILNLLKNRPPEDFSFSYLQQFDLITPLLEDNAIRHQSTLEKTIFRYSDLMTYIKQVVQKTRLEKYNVIGCSIDYMNILDTTLLSLYLKLLQPDMKIIWGGASVTQSPQAFEFLLKAGAGDGLIIGEGEYPMLKIVQGIPLQEIEGVKSLSNKGTLLYKKGIQLNLDELPTPDYTDIPLKDYFNIASLYTNRGCPNRCSFCGEWFLCGNKFRMRSPDVVIHDIEIILEKFHPEYIIFGESLINADLSYFETLCEKMAEKQFPIHFGCHFQAKITPDLARKAVKAGFDDAWVGVEALTEEELTKVHKAVNVSENLQAINAFTQVGINVIAMLVAGIGSEQQEKKNLKKILETIRYYSEKRIQTPKGEKKLNIQWRPAYMYLVPGSLDYMTYIKQGKVKPWKYLITPPSIKLQDEIQTLENALKKLPCEFERSVSDELLMDIMKQIVEADREAQFGIGGITAHWIKFMNRLEREKRRAKKKKKEKAKIATSIPIIEQRTHSKK
ncbi:MAG: B12-binding domain-containing radical SAM protein [Promethearchaeota archaeon]